MPATIAEFAAAAERSRAAGDCWRALPARRALVAVFDRVAADDAEAVAGVATSLLQDPAWVGDLLAPLIEALPGEPWGEPPLRVNRDPLRSGAILLDHPAVLLTATVLSAATLREQPPATTLVVPGRLTVTRYVKAGRARLAQWHAPPVTPLYSAITIGRCRTTGTRVLRDGEVVRHDGRTGAQLLLDPVSDVVTLTATVRADPAPVMREYDRASGAFLRMATTDDGAARSQVLLTFLRTARANGADACFEAATRDGAFFLRWSAMREWLAHDWRAARPRLAEMAAADPHPEVRATAAATLAQLIARTGQRRAA